MNLVLVMFHVCTLVFFTLYFFYIREGADAVDFRTQTKIKINSLIF